MLPRLLVIAKAPVAGRSKTRLCPPCTPEQAAELAAAAITDTLETVSRTDCGGRTIFLEGAPGEWLPEGFEIVKQVEGGLGDRLAAAFAHNDGPGFLIGMDTPQVTSESLSASMENLIDPGIDTVLGPSVDGGYWSIGMRTHFPGVFDGVPMSTDETGKAQLARLRQLGLSVRELPTMRDVDHFSDAPLVAAEHPDGLFARTFRKMETVIA